MKVSKRRLLALPILYLAALLCYTPSPAQTARVGIRKVVIDPGHGGQDPGCSYKQFKEKDIVLNVALRLGELIKDNFSDVEVIYTRKTDVFIPLYERGNIANKAGADLFFSIHVNAARSSAAAGTETFVMGVDKAGRNLDIAMKENDVITFEDDYSAKYQGYVPGSSESFIIFSLMQYSYQGQSLTLANMVQRQYVRNTAMGNRGVKQAGFLVLWNAAMPSILTELGFISNAGDRALLTTRSGQEKLARSLFNAFSEYMAKSEGHSSWQTLSNASTAEDEAMDRTDGDATANGTGGSASSGNPSPGSSNTNGNTSSPGIYPTQDTAPGTKVDYRVQIMTSDRKVPKNSSRFGPYRGEVTEMITGGVYKYYVGCVASYKEALSLQSKLRSQFKDAFVVPFLGDKRITIAEARRLE